MIELLKSHAHIGSPFIVGLLFGACAAWIVWRPASRVARRVLVATVLGYWFVATPLGAGALAGVAGVGYRPLASADAAGDADTIVVLGAGEISYVVGGVVYPQLSSESLMRTLEAARVYRMLGGGTVVATGARVYPEVQLVPEADVIRAALISVGVAAQDIVVEVQSRSTREQALYVTAMLQARGITRFVLVTSKPHMRRSVAAFRVLGLQPVPSASPVRSEQMARPPLWMPDGESLHLSDMAIYDLGAHVYYWWMGWV